LLFRFLVEQSTRGRGEGEESVCVRTYFLFLLVACSKASRSWVSIFSFSGSTCDGKKETAVFGQRREPHHRNTR